MANRSKGAAAASAFAGILVGSVGLIHLVSLPRFQQFHNVDVLQLLASGMCYGASLVIILALIRGPQQQ